MNRSLIFRKKKSRFTPSFSMKYGGNQLHVQILDFLPFLTNEIYPVSFKTTYNILGLFLKMIFNWIWVSGLLCIEYRILKGMPSKCFIFHANSYGVPKKDISILVWHSNESSTKKDSLNSLFVRIKNKLEDHTK